MSESNVLGAAAGAVAEWIAGHIVPIVVTVVLGYVARQVKQAVPLVLVWMQTHIDQNTLATVSAVVADVVKTAEYKRLKAELAGEAFEALTWALGEADRRLNAMGIDIDTDELTDMLSGKLMAFLMAQGVSLKAPAVAQPRAVSINVDPLAVASAVVGGNSPGKSGMAARLWV